MSVNKFIIKNNITKFTSIPNKVLQNLKDMEALGLYVYLSSLPEGWEFHKIHLRKHFSIGIRKLDRLLKILADHKLVTISQYRESNGQFSNFILVIEDGTSFEINNIKKIEQSEIRSAESVHTDAEEPIQEPINKIYINKINKNKKNKNEIIHTKNVHTKDKKIETHKRNYGQQQVKEIISKLQFGKSKESST